MTAAPAPPRITIRPIGPEERALIGGLTQFYIYDFSEMSPPGDGVFAFDRTGLYTPLPGLDDYWRPGGHALLIEWNGEPAGFALINTTSHHGGAVERNMGEFFVARHYRRGGVASAAVRQVLALYPGQWEVAVAERNSVAKVFWPRAIASASNVSGLERREGDGRHWRGPIWSFTAERLP